MCGRYSFAVEDELIRERFGVTVRSAIYKARYNCAPSQELAVIANAFPGELRCFRWGLIPSWAKEPSIGNKLINARAETLSEKSSFRQAFRRRRCLVPADSFFEWKREPEKIPYRIMLKNEDPFAMAGIWEHWTGADGTEIHSFAVITTEPNELMRPIHDRMPAILLPENESRWLKEPDESLLQSLLKPYPGGLMTAYPVSKLVNSPKNDGPEILRPVT
jgi:putative SOS response-associated peptidase YedK